ncbi:MAG: winged helix-turn-helix domain-containing protein, partial [Deinococcus sp.]
MAVPDYQSFMRPLLEAVQDGQIHRMRNLYDSLAQHFQLTAADLAEMLPSGKQATYMNRIGWAKTYLVKAEALESPQRGVVQITENGRKLLAEHQQEISTRVLRTIPEFAQFWKAQTGSSVVVTTHNGEASPLSPEEQLEALYTELSSALADDLLTQIRALAPQQFEVLVVQLLVAMGYGGTVKDAGAALGKSGDNGIDGLIKQDPLGLDKVYLQAKQWTGNVGSQEVRNFSGSLTYHKASKGVLITTAGFSNSALDTARQIGNIILIDGG